MKGLRAAVLVLCVFALGCGGRAPRTRPEPAPLKQDAAKAATPPKTLLPPSSVAAPEPLNVHGGSWSCKFSTPGFPTSWQGPWQKVDCAPGSTYVFKLWIRGHDQKVKLIVNDADWKPLASAEGSASAEWTEVSTPSFETEARASLVIQVQDVGFYEGNSYIDDVFVGEPGGDNRAANAGFEDGSKHWTLSDRFTAERVAPFDVSDGVRALRLAASGTPVWKGPLQTVKGCAPDKTYVCTARIKGDGQKVKLYVCDESWNAITSSVLTAGPAWTEVSTERFETGSRTSLIVQVQDAADVAGLVHIDEVFLGEPGGANRVRNSGFEYGTAYWTIETPFSVAMADKAAPSRQPDAAPYAGHTGLHVPAGYKQVFSDEFGGATLDRTKWIDHYTCFVDHFHDELQRYRSYGVIVGDGVCTLQALRAELSDVPQGNYSSGVIQARKPFKHGYFEARIKLPRGKGFWPAFWLTSADNRWPPEWDIFEVADVPGRLYGYPHPVKADGAVCEWVEGAAGTDHGGARTIYEPAQGAPDIYEYVTYGMLWTSTDVIWYVNDVKTEHYRVNDAAGSNDNMWLILNLSVGGKWPGSPDATTPWPGDMLIDYVKVWQK